MKPIAFLAALSLCQPALAQVILISADLVASPREVTTADVMLAHTNAIRTTPVKESSELSAAAQSHANHLAAQQYGVYTDRYGRVIKLPSGHNMWGDGTPGQRAVAAGFVGPCSEILGCGVKTAQGMVDWWAEKDSDHYKVLLGQEYDVAGFGHSVNAWGQPIYVGLFGQQAAPLANRHYFIPSVDTPTLCHVCGENVYHAIHPWKNVSQEAAADSVGAIDPRVQPPGPVRYVRSEQMPADVPGHVWIPGRPGTRLEGFWVLYQVNVELFNCPTCKGSGIFRGAVCPSCDGAANAAKPKSHEQAPAKAQVSAVCGPGGCGTSGNVRAAARPAVRFTSRARGFRLLLRNRK